MNDFVVKNGIQLGGSAKGNASDVALSVNGYDLGVAAYDGVSFSVAAQDTGPQDLSFKTDGTKMYVAGFSNSIYEYNLSTAFDVSTASYVQSFSVSAQETSLRGMFFKPDGTKMYVTGSAGNDVNEYNLSTAWDISTASYVQNFSVSAQETSSNDLFFKPDGTKMYVIGRVGDDVNEYSLSTAWDISTASYVQNFSFSSEETSPNDIFFKDDGTKFYILGQSGNDVNEYTLSTAWDISTASYVQNFSVTAQETFPTSVAFNDNGTKMYILGTTGDTVYQYTTGTFTSLDLSTADAFEVTPTADVTLGFRYAPAAGNAKSFSVALTGADVGSSYDIANASYDGVSFSVAGEETFPTGLFFKPDGSKMYIIGEIGTDINEYTLSTTWDITSASYVQTFSVSTQESQPKALFFKPDGTKLYVVGITGDDINEYNLSTAWDISTASYSQNFSVASQAIAPNGLFFKPDGSKMYVVATDQGAVVASINEYSLSTAWDVSSASLTTSRPYSQLYPVYEAQAHAISFNSSGTRMYILGANQDTVVEYTLSTPWSISTASKSSAVIFSVASQETTPQGLFFKSDGTKMYIVGIDSDAVFQYSTGSIDIATITYPSSVVWSGGTAPTTPADGVTDLLTFYTEDGGNTYYGFKVGEAMA